VVKPAAALQAFAAAANEVARLSLAGINHLVVAEGAERTFHRVTEGSSPELTAVRTGPTESDGLTPTIGTCSPDSSASRLGLGQLAQLAHGQALVNQQGNAHEGGCRKGNQPEHDGDGGGRFLFYSKDRGQRNEAGDLRAAANPWELQRGADDGHGQQQHGSGKIHRVGEVRAERLRRSTDR
jgi:hypothetical protein